MSLYYEIDQLSVCLSVCLYVKLVHDVHSQFLNLNIFKAGWLISIKFYLKYHWVEGKAVLGDRMK